MYVDDFEGLDLGDFGALEAALRAPPRTRQSQPAAVSSYRPSRSMPGRPGSGAAFQPGRRAVPSGRPALTSDVMSTAMSLPSGESAMYVPVSPSAARTVWSSASTPGTRTAMPGSGGGLVAPGSGVTSRGGIASGGGMVAPGSGVVSRGGFVSGGGVAPGTGVSSFAPSVARSMLTPSAVSPLAPGISTIAPSAATDLPPGIGDGGGGGGGGGGGSADGSGLPDGGGTPADVAATAAAAEQAATSAALPGAEAKALTGAPGEWYKEPWLWSALSLVVGTLIVVLSTRKGKHKAAAGLGDLREKIHGAKLIVPDLQAGLFYAWSGGDQVCVFDRDGNGQACWPVKVPTIQAARDLMRQKIRERQRGGQEVT